MLYGCNDPTDYAYEENRCSYCGGYYDYEDDYRPYTTWGREYSESLRNSIIDEVDYETNDYKVKKYWRDGKIVYIVEIKGDININLPGGVQNVKGLQYTGKYINGEDQHIELHLLSNNLNNNKFIRDSFNNAFQNALQNALQNVLQNDAFRDTFRNALQNAFRNALRNTLRDAFRNFLRDSFDDNNGDALRNFLRNSLRDNQITDNQIEDNFRDFLKKKKIDTASKEI